MPTNTWTIRPNRTVATQIVWEGEGPILVVNLDLNNTVQLGDTDSIRATDAQGIVPLGPNGSVTVDGTSNLYCVNGNNSDVKVVTLKGGMSQFLGLTQGGGNLVLSSIQSPNYVPNTSGWIVRKDGSAEFHSILLPSGSGGSTIFVQGTQPVANNINDLWVNTSNSNSIYNWNGSAWVQNQFGTGSIQAGAITAALIAANTITAAQLAAGIVYAGIINGTTVNAATFTGSTFLGTNWEENSTGSFGYSGTPALGNLIFSDCALATATSTATDAHGNTAYAGRCSYVANGTATPTFIIQLFGQQCNVSTPAGITHAGSTSPANWSGGAPGIGELFSGVNGAADTAASAFIQSAQQSASGNPELNLQGTTVLTLAETADPTNGPALYANTQGSPKGKTAKNLPGTLVLTQTDSTLRSNATTTPTQLSGAFNIPANDAVANTCYRLRLYGTGTTGTTPPLFSITLDGMGATGQASTGWAAAALPASTTFEYWVEAIIMVNTTGAAGSARMFLSGGVSANGRPTTGQSINFGAANTAVTVDTTTLSQMLIKIAPGSITGAPSINGHASTFERLGP